MIGCFRGADVPRVITVLQLPLMWTHLGQALSVPPAAQLSASRGTVKKLTEHCCVDHL